MVFRVLGVLALVIGAIFAVVMLLVLLPFLDNFNLSLLILAGVFGVLAYVFLAIGWQLFHPPEGRGTHADEPPAEGDDEAHLVPTGEGTIALTSGATVLAEVTRERDEPVVARAPEPEAESELAYVEMESFPAQEVEPEPAPAAAPAPTPEPAPVVAQAPEPEPAPRPSAQAALDPPNVDEPANGGSNVRSSEGSHRSDRRIPSRRNPSTFKKKGAALPRR
ncbi:MAG: hypothetical protein KKA32_06565 [Actinobacteria bacterium]|nr:hypothetical protein [Actinomycetota bacterium]